MLTAAITVWELLEQQPIAVVLLLTTIGWHLFGALFLLTPIPDYCKEYKDDIQNRLPAVFHSTIVCVLSAIRYFNYEQDFAGHNLFLDNFILCYTLGYFVYDFTFMYFLGLLGKAMILHHVVAVICLGNVIFSGHGGNATIISIIFAEISNPAMHLRVILRDFGLRYTKIYEVLEFSFLGSYIFGRLIMWTPVVI